MSRFGNIFYLCLLFGALWGAIATLLITLLALFISGEPFQPQITAGAIGGCVAAGILTAFAPPKRTIGLRALSGLAFVLVLTVASGATPMGMDLSIYSVGQLVFIAITGWLVIQAIHLTAAGFGPGRERRYNVEVICLRFVKGFGIVAFTIAVALPFFVMIMMSLKNQQLLLSNPLDFSIDFSQGFSALFRSYIELFSQYHFGSYLMNSTLVSIVTVLVTLFFAVPGAYAVARLKFPGQHFLSRSILLIYMVPMIVLVIPLYAIFSQMGMRNTLWGLMLVYPATTIPVALYMLQGYFRGIPAELEEAGLMDGLSRLNVIRKITMPLALPAMASVALYVFMIAWNEFLFAFMFLDNVDLYTLSRGIAELNSSEVPRQHLMAGAVIATVPVLALFLWFERFLVTGLTAGSVKG